MAEVIAVITRGFAYALKCFVINSCAAIDDSIVDVYGLDAAARSFLKEASNHGGTNIIGPGGNIIAGPLPPGEGILYADLRLDEVLIPKFIHDFAGHYNRPELFASLLTANEAPSLKTATPSQAQESKETKTLVVGPQLATSG